MVARGSPGGSPQPALGRCRGGTSEPEPGDEALRSLHLPPHRPAPRPRPRPHLHVLSLPSPAPPRPAPASRSPSTWAGSPTRGPCVTGGAPERQLRLSPHRLPAPLVPPANFPRPAEKDCRARCGPPDGEREARSSEAGWRLTLPPALRLSLAGRAARSPLLTVPQGRPEADGSRALLANGVTPGDRGHPRLRAVLEPRCCRRRAYLRETKQLRERKRRVRAGLWAHFAKNGKASLRPPSSCAAAARPNGSRDREGDGPMPLPRSGPSYGFDV